MIADVLPEQTELPLPRDWWVTLRLLYGELVRMLLAGLVVSVASLPLLGAAFLGIDWLIALSALLPALAVTGAAVFVGTLFRGRPRVADLFRWDLGLALTLWAPVVLGALLVSVDSVARIAGIVLLAGVALIYPALLGYRGARDTGVLLAWRNAVVVVALRPGYALTVTAAWCILGFGVAATFGVLALVAIPLGLALATTTSRSVILHFQPDAQVR